jgi:chemotaxis protein CheD
MIQTRSLPELYLKPGDYYFGEQPTHVHTVLGSCVAVSIFHRHTGLAAMCHAVQPDCGLAEACKNRCAQYSRYVCCVVPAMVRSFFIRKIRPADLAVKLFGGAAITGDHDHRQRQLSVGAMNVATARQVLQRNGLTLDVIDAGGDFGRKIIFNTQTGVVLMKRIPTVPYADTTDRRSNGSILTYDPIT